MHPIFSEGFGTAAQSLQSQAALLLLNLNGIPYGVIHRLLGVNHKAIEDVENKLCKLRRDYVEATEKLIKFGDSKGWHDVEADEAMFDKRNVSNVLDVQHFIKSKNETAL